jgi:hypothetical protein
VLIPCQTNTVLNVNVDDDTPPAPHGPHPTFGL